MFMLRLLLSSYLYLLIVTLFSIAKQAMNIFVPLDAMRRIVIFFCSKLAGTKMRRGTFEFFFFGSLVPLAIAEYLLWIDVDRGRRMFEVVLRIRNDCHHQVAHFPSIEKSHTDRCPRNILKLIAN